MLLRYFSPLIIIFFLLGCKPNEKELQPEKIHRIGVLGLFKPSSAELSFPDNVLVKTDNNEFILLPKHNKIIIECLGSYLMLENNENIYKSTGFVFFTQNQNPYYDKFQITIPDKITRTYTGGLEVKTGKNEINLIVLQKTEDLVTGILSSESSDTEMEYLKGLSVIIRTYILFNHTRHSAEEFDFCDNTHCMVFYGNQNKNSIFRSAVNSTKGEVLKYNDQLIDVYFTGECGGKTKTPNEIWENYKTVYPYSSILCPNCQNSHHNNWSWSIPKNILLKLYPDIKIIKDFKTETSPALPEIINVISDKTNIRITKDEFRLSVGRTFGWNKIYSNNYSFTVNNDSIYFVGHGFGHCIGFCQSGAEEMSRQGKTYKEILLFYYPNTTL